MSKGRNVAMKMGRRVLVKIAVGCSYRQVAAENTSNQTVCNLMKKWRESDSVADGSQSGKPKVTT